ncbi:MAG TPA: DUF4340 domain-containing protein [Patescibacteria group bacterium]|nr:DUF4340 domain-containing protein [Patescibacteria group bacterium]
MFWSVVAGVLCAASLLHHHFVQQRAAMGPARMLPQLRPEAVTSVLIRPSGAGQMQIRVDHTNNTWQMSQPHPWPAEADKVRKFLAFLEQLRPAPYITGSELRNHPGADEEYGFVTPQATVLIQQGDYTPRLRVGTLTNPGDQVFVQVEGDLGAYVVDSELLKFLPHSANDWRDTTVLDVDNLAFDRLAVTNNAKGDTTRGGLPSSSLTFVVQREPTNSVWHMVWPLDARANHTRIEHSLADLDQLRIRQFVSDDPKPDLEGFGLAPAELELGLARGTNSLAILQFGRSPTNDLTQVYARRAGQNAVFTVDKALLLAWCAFLNDFRDPRLLDSTAQVDNVELVRGEEQSSLQHQSDGSWRIFPGDFPADPMLARSLLSTLTNLQILKFVNDVVNTADLPEYGLASPAARLLLTSSCLGAAGNATNRVLAELDFGSGTNHDVVFAKRTDESFVYAVSTNDFARLPTAMWQLRDRKLCRFSQADVTGLTLRRGAQVCRLIHKGPLRWAFAPGSQGIINDAAIEETVRGVVQVSAICWVGRGQQSLTTLGFAPQTDHLSLELKDGARFELDFGAEAPSGDRYAYVTLNDQPWIMEFPWMLYRDISSYLPLSPAR